MEEHYSLGGKVFQQLKNSILAGEFENGAELREIALAKKLGVSRTPVREALRQLEQEGLVEIYPNRGAYVKGITYKDVEDIFRIRARLEGLCAEMAVSSITHEQLDKLDEIILLSKFYEEKKDMEHLLKMDSQFHEVLFESCGSKMLEHQLKDYHQYVQKARLRSLKRQERAKKSTQEHEEILLAIKDRDAKRADELATRHILNAIANIRLEHES
ncbi:Uncharacterized HTH-type transcriptional regulator ydfH [uncultured Clostridium sp.]|uniref:GntR family transcriptional regulator n=1 Tax=Muricoprocola aceti TaxID=2981772 RepID=A0ABT2SHJ0_9FIRM|nr:GntR family transcriptional regulator [Muricoprocola aceti]MCI7225853.1 GntR family transcriptional regulator [Lachnospiraceae bacterium]MCQ4772363.1 GntR family transcriptional regulator [Lacrimispora saccharolytica]RGD64789.1 GntR family transcriptional regulator [Lachnospiraceae bacterium OF09-6]SCG95053.1 Uncharacterized HTH-type transcriptional regulator ydfH [uncultured Clostridium sp.]MCU6723959.1 GntR family transcriptional regulator [Muricoprocola aceti]